MGRERRRGERELTASARALNVHSILFSI